MFCLSELFSFCHIVRTDQEGSVVGDRQQQDSYQRHKTAPMHQVSDERGGDDFNMSLYAEDERRQLEDRREDLLRKQRELIEQKRQIQSQREQEEINQFIQHQKEKLYAEDQDYEPPHYVQKESKVERFMKLANALYVCDQDQSGKFEHNNSPYQFLRNSLLVILETFLLSYNS